MGEKDDGTAGAKCTVDAYSLPAMKGTGMKVTFKVTAKVSVVLSEVENSRGQDLM